MSNVIPAFATPVYMGMVRGSAFDNIQKEIEDSLPKVDFKYCLLYTSPSPRD